MLAADLTGKVVGVQDGDTLTLLVPDGTSFKQVKVRLGEIDTPESRQPYGQRAKQALYRLEEQAKTAKRGLWGLPEAECCPPWDWRWGTCTTASAPAARALTAAPTPAASSGGFTCAGKRYCREMTSCEEAKFYLVQCGLKGLDRDGDGVPCASLYRP